MNKSIFVALLAFILSACAVGPDYKAPQTTPAALLNAQSPQISTQNPEAAWWQQFQDSELDSLVGRALGANLDLRIAVDRVGQARAVFVGNELDFAPHAPLQ